MTKLFHTTISIDNRCLDLLLTEEEIAQAFGRSLLQANAEFIDTKICCKCWPTTQPPKCSFWNKILGYCKDCE